MECHRAGKVRSWTRMDFAGSSRQTTPPLGHTSCQQVCGSCDKRNHAVLIDLSSIKVIAYFSRGEMLFPCHCVLKESLV